MGHDRPRSAPAPPVMAEEHAAAARARPAAGGGPAGRALALQALVGNRRTVALLQRDPTPTPVPAPAPSQSQSQVPPFTDAGRPLPPALGAPPALSPAQQAQLDHAEQTLKAVPPLGEAQTKTLDAAIPGAAVYDLIRQRDAQRLELEQKTAGLAAAKLTVGTKPEHGVPYTQEEVDALAAEVETAAKEVEDLNRLIAAALGPLGLDREEQLVELVTVRFPELFVERGKQIALAELDSNRAIAEKELHRYGLDACVDPAARNALVAAARELVDRDAELKRLEGELETAKQALAPLPGGTPDPAVTAANQAKADAVTAKLEKARADRVERHKALSLQHPLLLRQLDLAALASGDEAQIDEVAGGTLRGILADIDTTKEKVAAGDLKVWNLQHVVGLTARDLGIAGQPILEEVVQQKIQAEVSAEADVKMAVAALSITAGLIATFATGGLALAAGGVMLASGVYTASESVKTYLAESAAGNVALDPQLADLSKNEPELGWLILDLVSVGLDAAQVVGAVKQLGKAAKAAQAAEDVAAVEEFAKAARRVLPPAAAGKVLASMGRRTGAELTVGRTIKAIKSKFRTRDLRAVARRLDKIADKGYKAVFENLRRQGRVHPLNREGLIRAVGAETAQLLIDDGKLALNGFYHPTSGMLFVKDGGLDAFAATVVHETTHWMQHTQVGRNFYGKVDEFVSEFEAFAMERRYLRSVLKSAGGNLDAIPAGDVWLVGATDEAIVKHIEDVYKLPRPESFDGTAAVEETLRRMGGFGH